MLSNAPAALGCLVLLSSLSQTLSQHLEDVGIADPRHQRLAVLLPASQRGGHDGQWPTGCSPWKTTRKVDLVLYVPRHEGFAGAEAQRPNLPQNHCFAEVRTVYGPEASPREPHNPSSDMLYSAFLDKVVHSQLSEYDALAVIPSLGDTATATDFSVDTLHDLAFSQHASEGKFWVKTLTLGGDPKKLRGGDGQNGRGGDASIYDNDDLEFVQFVRATSKLQRHQGQQQWGASASPTFDEALSLTLQEPHYEKRAVKFVTAGTTPTSGEVDQEGVPVSAATTRKLQRWRDNKRYKSLGKWKGDVDDGVEPKWKSEQKWKAEQKWMGDPEDGVPPKWKAEQKWKTKYCDPDCERTSNDGTKGRVCDHSCDSGEPYGKNGCSAKGGMYGMYCRVCYNDMSKAQRNDSPHDRAIMCDTMEPLSVYTRRSLTAVEDYPDEIASRAARRLQHSEEHHEQLASPNETTRKLTKWRDNKRYKSLGKWKGDVDDGVEPKWKSEQKWKAEQKWMGDPEDGVPPKWKAEQKWKTKYCDPDCERTSNDGTKGRVCDHRCDSGEPYGKNGCSAKGGMYGMYCRVCYNDMSKAQRNDSPHDRAIMCDTMEPLSVYSARGLAAEATPDHHSGNTASDLAGKLLAFKRDHDPNAV